MTSTEIASASKVMLGTTEAVAMYIGSTKIWPTNSPQPHDYSQDYFTIESLVDNNGIGMYRTGNSPGNRDISYSTDNGTTWTNVTLVNNTDFPVTINTGNKILFKGVNNNLSTSWDKYWEFTSSKNIKVYGNAMSLLFGDNFTSNSEFTSGTTHNLCGLFYGADTLIDASNLILPALTCTQSCYNGMFRSCTNLQYGPQLPALYSAQDCYSSMFEGCINLEDAGVPEINLVDMSQTCCKRMFCMNRSSKLTTPKMTKSPILRCATGATKCYEEMFKGNGNLTEITCLLTGGQSNCCANWIANACANSGTFYKASNAAWTSYTPPGWTIQDYVEPS